MIHITELNDLYQAYDYQQRLHVPYYFSTDFETWKTSFLQDTDGEGRLLFRSLQAKAAWDGDRLVGFIQYGSTAFGFDDCGEISDQVSYPVIRAFFFDRGREDAAALLLRPALQDFAAAGRVYAFFHYFGMTCFARHGKLFQQQDWIREFLLQNGFVVEHENVYYSAVLSAPADSPVALRTHDLTAGRHKVFDFMLEDGQIGGCEVHYVSTHTAYLRWIYVNDTLQNRGIGSACMDTLKAQLYRQGITRLDTDTALDNLRAQRYYEKNRFTREGITRSFHLTK